MTIRPILHWPDPALVRVADPVTDLAGTEALIADMFDTMYAAPGRGLAGPQIGVGLRVFVMDAGWKDGDPDPVACINPVLERLDGAAAVAGDEACLSMPGVSVRVDRAARVALAYSTPDGVRHSVTLDGAAARIAQHEYDHLDGIMHIARLAPEDRAAAIARFTALS